MNGKELLRTMLGFADEDDEGHVLQHWFEEDVWKRTMTTRRGLDKTLIQMNADPSPSSYMSVVSRVEGRKCMLMLELDLSGSQSSKIMTNSTVYHAFLQRPTSS